ncbi:MAG: lipopolysaccharide heptosyltransferase II [Porticoccaceae bacterium]
MTASSETHTRILIVGPSWVGDMVMAQVLFIVLKQRYPDCRITVLAPAWSRPLLERMPEVDAAVDMPVGHGSLDLGSRRDLASKLAAQGYDWAIVLPNSLKSALIPAFAGIPRRTGWRGEMRFWLLNDIRLLHKTSYPLMVERFVALAYPPNHTLPKPLPNPKLRVNVTRVAELKTRLGLDEERPVLALCPGAEFGPAKRWPEAYYAEVASEMITRGWQVWLQGSERDQPVAETIIAALPESARAMAFNLAGSTELAEAIDLLSAATLVVSNDSGLMHVAAALERPLVVVYGSTSPDFTPPLADKVEVLSIPVDCGPCFQRECPKQHLKCLNDLKPDMALAAIDRLLSATET